MKTICKISFLLFFTLIFKTNCKADTICISIEDPTTERILLYDGKYCLKLKLTESKTKGQQTLHITYGTYQIKENEIYFKETPYPKDTIKNTYFTSPPSKKGAEYNLPFDKIIKNVFGKDIVIDTKVDGYTHFDPEGTLFPDGTFWIGLKKKYTMEEFESKEL